MISVLANLAWNHKNVKYVKKLYKNQNICCVCQKQLFLCMSQYPKKI